MAGTSIVMQAADVVKSGREVEERRMDYVCVLVLVDKTAPRSLALPVRDAFDPRQPNAEVRVVAANSGRHLLMPTIPDVCVAVMGTDERNVADGVSTMALAGVPVAIVVESALDVPPLALGPEAARLVSTISATSSEVLVERLAEWLVDATGKSVAFAASFPFCRKAKVRELINDFAMENAMGTAKLGPKAELPSMTVNQARLALAIAAINGQPLALGRIPEVLTAISAGAGSRAVANKALGRLPIVGWFFKVGFGYLGTQATGMTLQRRFDKREERAENPDMAQASASDHPSVARRVVDAVRRRASHHEGAPVRSSSGAEVRLLPVSEEGGFLVYEQDGGR